MSWQETASVLAGDTLPGSTCLVTEGVPEPLSAAYAEAKSWIETATPVHVTWRPGRSLTVRYRVSGHGLLEGTRQVVAVIGDIPEGALVVAGPDGSVGVWVVPHDPRLPGLASALDVATVGQLLRSLGATQPVENVRLRSYRPGRRAVVEVEAHTASIFLKVVPPEEAESLHARHRRLSAVMPVPDSLGVSREMGIVVMKALSGSSLRAVLRGKAPDLPPPVSIAALLDSLPQPEDDARSPSPLARSARTAELLARLVPDAAARIAQMIGDIGPDPGGARVPVHGDFHEAQVMVRGKRATGLIDVDDFGWGHPADDPATMLGHLTTLAPSCRHPDVVLAFAHHLNRIWDHLVDPGDLRRRTAAVVLGLATGPFRVQLPNWPEETRSRIDKAVEWIESARSVGATES